MRINADSVKRFIESPHVTGAAVGVALTVIMALVAVVLFQPNGVEIGSFLAGMGFAIGTGVLGCWTLYKIGQVTRDVFC